MFCLLIYFKIHKYSFMIQTPKFVKMYSWKVLFPTSILHQIFIFNQVITLFCFFFILPKDNSMHKHAKTHTYTYRYLRACTYYICDMCINIFFPFLLHKSYHIIHIFLCLCNSCPLVFFRNFLDILVDFHMNYTINLSSFWEKKAWYFYQDHVKFISKLRKDQHLNDVQSFYLRTCYAFPFVHTIFVAFKSILSFFSYKSDTSC